MNPKQNLFSTNRLTASLTTAILLLASSVFALGQEERVVHRFQGGSDGIEPNGGLISDQAGNLYGTTEFGGAHSGGTVFELSPPSASGGWTKTVLYNFCAQPECADGSEPFGELIFDQAGNLYGTLLSGTLNSGVFELRAPTAPGDAWTESIIYNVGPGRALDGLIFDKAGSLYGATSPGYGTIFKLTPSPGGSWTETTIFYFDGHDGEDPISGPIIDAAGNLYGVLQMGKGGTFGAIYELRPPTTPGGAWVERLLYNFTNSADGLEPSGRLMLDGHGNLDGVTLKGGANGDGTVFQLRRQDASWSETVLYSFCAESNCADGEVPQATLVSDSKGNLYGTTQFGGSAGECGQDDATCGTVFQLTPPAIEGGAWTQTVLHEFTGGSGSDGDGANPLYGLTLGKTGSLWGTTPSGGKDTSPCGTYHGCGTVFHIFH
jgi:uncharacterized repeat protein (TIGR03803 family)